MMVKKESCLLCLRACLCFALHDDGRRNTRKQVWVPVLSVLLFVVGGNLGGNPPPNKARNFGAIRSGKEEIAEVSLCFQFFCLCPKGCLTKKKKIGVTLVSLLEDDFWTGAV